MKAHCLLLLSIFVSFSVYAADPQPHKEGAKVYRNDFINSTEIIRVTGNSSISTYHDAARLLEEVYGVKFDIHEIALLDINNNSIFLLDVNIITDKPYNEIFAGPAHRSLLIEEIRLNLLQPYLSWSEWSIDALVLKLNGIFTDSLGLDRTYTSLVTRSDLLDYLWRMEEAGRVYFTD
jgi:hypothetical protein